jgi:hypothetical protein
MVNVDDANYQQRLHWPVIKIKKLWSEVIKGYNKHYKKRLIVTLYQSNA